MIKEKMKQPQGRKQGKKKNVKYTGYWVSKWSGFLYDKSWTSIFHITRALALLIFSIFHVLLAAKFKENIGIIEKMILVNFGILYINSTLMVFPLLYNSKNMISFCSVIRMEFHQPKINLSPKQLAVREYTRRYVRQFSSNVACILYSALIYNFVRRFIFEGFSIKVLPVNGWLPFEINTWLRYSAVFILQIFTSINVITVHIGFLIAFVTHSKFLCEQFEILSLHIQETFENNFPTVSIGLYEKNVERAKYINSRIKTSVQLHINLLKYYNLFQETYSLFLLIFALSTGAMICTVVYVITDPTSTLVQSITCFGTLFLPEVFIIGIYCWFGQEVTNKYKCIQNAAYSTPWYTQPVSTQRLLLNLLTICQRERNVKGGGLQQFSLLGFSELLQASFSYFNVLNAMRQ